MLPVVHRARVAFALGLASAGVLAAAACSTRTLPPTAGGGTDTPVSGGGGGASPEAGASTATCGFATTPSAFALPTIGGAPIPGFPALAGQVACTSGGANLDYTLADLTGDGLPDLVVTTACADTTVGAAVWLVYPGSAAGFATAPLRFTLPPAPVSVGCATVVIFDANGDSLPDYVETALCNDATVGTSRWLVYANSGTGFAQTSAAYALPPGASSGAFATIGTTTSSCAGNENSPAFQLLDIDGDGTLDFVITQACGDPTVGSTAWQVYRGSASGAAQTSVRFSLPTTPTITAGAFTETSGALSCSGTVSKPQFSLLDFDADGKIDIVVTANCSEAEVGTSAWLLYPNSGTGFAASPQTLALPTIAEVPAGSFTALASVGKCANGVGTPTYTIADLNADGRPDLVLTADCADTATGVAYWQLFPNDGAGFSAPHSLFTLPSVLGATTSAPVSLSGAMACTATPVKPAFTTTYLTSAAFQLVVTGECSDTTVGESRWLVFGSACK